ncbi:MAG: ABC transporter substrate-binding protein [Thermomicrobiales bacterium]
MRSAADDLGSLKLTRRHVLRAGAVSAGAATGATGGLLMPRRARALPQRQADVPRERTLILGFAGGPVQTPELCNPYVPSVRLDTGLRQAVIESLFYLNIESGEIMPWLAEGYQYNPENRQVDITLRAGVMWSDGAPFTADDVAFTLDTLRTQPSLTYGPEMEQWVESVQVVDPQTVRVTLTGAYPRFIYNNFTGHLVNAVSILPKHIWEGQDPTTFTNFDADQGWPVFTGPYRLVGTSESEFVYDRRDDWWGATTGFSTPPAPERIIFTDGGTDDRTAALLQANELDGAPRVPFSVFVRLKEENPDAIAWLAEEPYGWIDPCPAGIGIQTETAPWDDVDLRWAVSLAVDRGQFGEAMGFGPSILTRYNFPAYLPLVALLDENADLFEQYDTLEYNPDTARERIESKGYQRGGDGIYAKDGQRLQAEMPVASAASDLMTGATLMVAYLREVGIELTPRPLAVSQYFDRINLSQFNIENFVACGSITDPYAEMAQFHSRFILPIGERRSGNRWGYNNPDYDAVMDEMALAPPDDPEIAPLFRSALEMRLRDLPHIPLVQQSRVVPYTTRYWTNWPTAENNYIHPANWWASTLQILLQIQPVSA